MAPVLVGFPQSNYGTSMPEVGAIHPIIARRPKGAEAIQERFRNQHWIASLRSQ
jgi:hypothetical protein